MPKRFTPQQLAASASVGEVRTEASFNGDTGAWHTYQETVFRTLMQGELPPVGDSERAKRWKAARRQAGKIEEQRTKDADGLAALVTDEKKEGLAKLLAEKRAASIAEAVAASRVRALQEQLDAAKDLHRAAVQRVHEEAAAR